jgi:sodium--glutamate symport carrier gltS
LSLDLIQTVAFAGVALFLGYWLKKRVPLLARYNIPAPVVGGLPIAALFAFINRGTPPLLAFDTALQVPLQNAFFASVGFGASVRVLARGGPLVLVMMIIASVSAALQNVVGGGVGLAARRTSVDGRARRLGDADGRAGHGAGVCAALRERRREWRRDAGGVGGHGRHRGRWRDGRSDCHVSPGAARHARARHVRP